MAAADTTIFGHLMMPGTPTVMDAPIPVPAPWISDPLNKSLLFASIIIFLCTLKSLYLVFPDMRKCVFRWRWAFTLEGNMSLVHARDAVALSMLLPSSLVVSRYFLTSRQVYWSIGMIVVFLIARWLVYELIRSRVRGSGEAFTAAHKDDYNILTMTSMGILVVTGISTMCGLEENILKWIILGLTLLMYLTLILRKHQILRSEYSTFPTFLYLCALEILPLAITAGLYLEYGQ